MRRLAVFESEGDPVEVRFEVPGPARLRLVVGDRGARHPLGIDPLPSAVAEAQLEANQAGAAMGASTEFPAPIGRRRKRASRAFR